MFKSVSIALLMLITLVVLIYSLNRQGSDRRVSVLTVHCAAGLQKPIREIARQYEADNDVEIALNLAGSGVLESQMKIAGGDLYIPADETYVLKAKSEGLIGELAPLVSLRAVIVVQKGNPKGIKSLEDLKKGNMRLSMADSTAAIGRYVEEALTDSGDWSSIVQQVIVTKPTVNHVIEDVANATVDAALAWDSVAAAYKDVDIVRVPWFEARPRIASVGVIEKGNVKEALLFMHYLVCGDADVVFKNLGYQPVRSKECNDE